MRKPRPDIGWIECPMCGREAALRKCGGPGRRTLYWVCQCGKIEPATPEGQGYILSRATLYGPGDEGTAPPPPPAVPSPDAAAPEPEEAEESWFF